MISETSDLLCNNIVRLGLNFYQNWLNEDIGLSAIEVRPVNYILSHCG